MAKRKICVVTGTRAEYGLLYWLMREIADDQELTLQIVATGMHLAPEFGLTYRQIENDGFTIDEKVEMLLASDTPTGIAKSMGLGVIGFADALQRLSPDIVVLLGDRYEILTAAETAMLMNIPIAHIHGGELTEGAVDDAIRHAITKMATLHFTAAPEYRRRVIQMGEQPARVYDVGPIGHDNIVKMDYLPLDELSNGIGFYLGEKFFLVTYHPVTIDAYRSQNAVHELFAALDKFLDYKVLITKANSDAGGREINKAVDEYAKQSPDRVKCVTSLGQKRYLSAMRLCSAVVGNSSSGILEAPLLHKPTVNIGAREKGRIRYESVIDCEENRDEICAAIEKSISKEFQQRIKNIEIPYTDGKISQRIKNVLRDTSLEELARKKFYDVKWDERDG